MEDLYIKRSPGERILASIGTAPLGFPNHTKRPGWSGWSKEPSGSLKKPNSGHLITANMGAQQFPHRRLTSRSRWGTRPWAAWAAMEYQQGLPINYLVKLNVDPKWWAIPRKDPPTPPITPRSEESPEEVVTLPPLYPRGEFIKAE